MKILRVISTVDPKGGGPMEGARKIDTELLRLGHTVQVVCLDDPGEAFLSNYPAPVQALGPSSLGYGYNAKMVPWLKEHAKNFDAVIVNGLWQYHGFAAWRALAGTSIPYFVFTHGMLDPWFKHAYPLKHLKKWLYWPWAEYRVLRDAAAVLFTTDEERIQSRKSFWLYKCREKTTAYGTSAPPLKEGWVDVFLKAWPELAGKRVFLFLSRIHEKKGCDLLVEAFAKVAAKDLALHLVIAGPDQTGLVAKLKERAERLGIADRITWPGMLAGDMKWGAFYAAEAFCLPSHQENFGIAVAEALACGTPVLISNKVNIWREIEADKAGIVGDDTVEGAAFVFHKWLALSSAERSAMAAQALPCFNRRFRIDQVVADLVGTIQAELSKR